VRGYLAPPFAERTTRHGVFMDILGLGVLLTGESGLGKSELGLELISAATAWWPTTRSTCTASRQTALEGRCPELLLNLLEVRGIGLLDIKAIFGETAVRRKMRLKLIVHLVRKETMEREFERLPYEPLYEDVLGMPVRKVVIAVDAGRNLAVLVEAAVRNTILQLRGIDTYQEFIERHQKRDGAKARAVMMITAPMRAVGLGAARVQRQRVLLQLEAAVLRRWRAGASRSRGRRTLPRGRSQAHQVVVVLAFVELEHRLARLEVAARQQPACSNCISTR
jgi:hypothetical protein